MNRLILFSLLASGISWGENHAATEPTVYRVDADSADIRVLIYRAGALSGLGHNHVISVGELDGTVVLDPDPEQSRFEFTIPVQGLVVDDPALRKAEGEGFSSEPSEKDIAGTRRNMLGKRVLDAEQYPTITVTGTPPRADGEGDDRTQALDLSIELLGRVIELQAPVALQQNGDSIEASGEFTLSHGELGMKPFTALFGSLRVADEMDVKYRVVLTTAARSGT